jgi:hypothetical protein
VKDLQDATYIHYPVHEINPSSHQLAARLHGHFHATVTPRTDWNRGEVILRIVAPHEAVLAAVSMYLAEREPFIAWSATREAS